MTYRLRAGPSAAENGHGHSQSDCCGTAVRAPQWQRQRSDFTSGGGGSGGSSGVAGVTRQVTCSIDPPSEYQQMAAAPRANVQHFPLRTAVPLPNRNHNSNSTNRVICIAPPPTEKQRAHHKTTISLFSGVHTLTGTVMFSVGNEK